MKLWILIFVLSLGNFSCSKSLEESPLALLVGAEPSAKMRNDFGIEHYHAGRYWEAVLQFNQASFADPTSGEIHYNLGLSYFQEGKKEKAIRNFRLAQKRARGNPKILESPILNELLQLARQVPSGRG
jgi:tetratricopeptide (TPR) repeat protein